MVSKPAGIRTVLSNIPNHTGHDGGDPRRYFKLGRFTMGNSDGFQFSHGLEYVQQLLYPMPAVWELLAYDIKDGASCVFQELVGADTVAALDPWDRAPSQVSKGELVELGGGAGITTIWTYTVPAGRKLYLARATCRTWHTTAPSTASVSYSYMDVGGNIILYAENRVGTVGVVCEDQHNGGPMVLPPAAVISAKGTNGDTGGSVRAYAGIWGFLFDA